MKIIFFDLGDTLVRQVSAIYESIPGALDTLREIYSMKDKNNYSPIIGLVIDTHDPREAPLLESEKTNRKNEIIRILEETKIKEFFEPIESRMTLSTELGFTKSENLRVL